MTENIVCSQCEEITEHELDTESKTSRVWVCKVCNEVYFETKR